MIAPRRATAASITMQTCCRWGRNSFRRRPRVKSSLSGSLLHLQGDATSAVWKKFEVSKSAGQESDEDAIFFENYPNRISQEGIIFTLCIITTCIIQPRVVASSSTGFSLWGFDFR